jgi:hypothetical protein
VRHDLRIQQGGARLQGPHLTLHNQTMYQRPLQNLLQVVGKLISINGFLITRLAHKYQDKFYKTAQTRCSRQDPMSAMPGVSRA